MHVDNASRVVPTGFEALFRDAVWPGRDRLRQRFRCDRRETPRWSVAGSATILTLGTELGTVVELTRLDGAPWWLGGDAVVPIAPGTKVSIGFSHPDGRPARGVVVRCEGFGEGRYRIAVRFEADGVV